MDQLGNYNFLHAGELKNVYFFERCEPLAAAPEAVGRACKNNPTHVGRTGKRQCCNEEIELTFRKFQF